MTGKELHKIGKWLNAKGYGLELTDGFWMEDYTGEYRFRELAELLHDYLKENKENNGSA